MQLRYSCGKEELIGFNQSCNITHVLGYIRSNFHMWGSRMTKCVIHMKCQMYTMI